MVMAVVIVMIIIIVMSDKFSLVNASTTGYMLRAKY